MTGVQTCALPIFWRAGVRTAANNSKWFLADASYETLDAHWIANEVWPAWVASLPPRLRTTRDVGGGKEIAVPRWIAEVWDCDDHALSFWEFVIRCRAKTAAENPPAQYAGTGGGTLAYVAELKAGNLRLGAHDIFWFIDGEKNFRVFEPADGSFVVLTAGEIASVMGGEAR